jgi:hypothetical protein
MKLRVRLVVESLEPRRVLRATNTAERKVLTQAGREARKFARGRMRRRKGPSRPGQGPTVWRGQLKRFLLFAYDPIAGVVVVGPKRLPGARGDTPEVLEHGGHTSRRVGRGRNRRRERVTYKKRPAMLPALEKTAPDLPGLWRDAIRG